MEERCRADGCRELRLPLLGHSDGGDGGGRRQRHELRKPDDTSSSMFGTVMNLVNTVIGAGMMALPYQLAILGVVLGVLLNCGLATLLCLSSTAILRSGDRSEHRTYTDVVRGELGNGWGHFVRWCIILQGIGGLAVYLIIIGDVLVGSAVKGCVGIVPTIVHIFHSEVDDTWFTTRWFVVLVICVFFLMPLVTRRNLSSLGHSSAFAVGLAVAFTIIVLALAINKAVNGLTPSIAWGPNLKLAGSNPERVIVSILAAVPVMVPAYIAHMNIPPLMAELRRYSKTRMTLATKLGYAVCLFIYVVISIGAFATFGNSTQPDILLNFSPGSLSKFLDSKVADVIAFVVAVVYVSKLILVFPMVNWAVRENLCDLLFGESRPVGLRFYLITYATLIVVYVLSLVVNSIDIALAFIGCTASMGVALLAPGVLLVKCEIHKKGSVAVGITCLVIGVLMFISGNAKIISGFF